ERDAYLGQVRISNWEDRVEQTKKRHDMDECFASGIRGGVQEEGPRGGGPATAGATAGSHDGTADAAVECPGYRAIHRRSEFNRTGAILHSALVGKRRHF